MSFGTIKLIYQTGIKNLTLKSENVFRNAGNKGLNLECWFSYLKALQTIVESNYANPTLILEDDFLADADATSLIKEVFDNIPKDWDVVHVGHCVEKWICSKFLSDNICLAKRNMVPCLHGYIEKNCTVASELFKSGNSPVPILADDFHHKNNLNRYVIFPFVFSQF